MVIKEISDLLGTPERDGETDFSLGGERKEDILDKNGNPTDYTIVKPKTSITNTSYLYNPLGIKIGILNGMEPNELFDYNCTRTGFYIENNKIKYDKYFDERRN